MSQWRLEVRHRTFSRTGFDKLSDVEFKFTLYYYKFWCILQRSSLNYCCHLFCLGVSGALQILCQDHKDIQSELTNLKVLQQNQLNNQKMSNFIIFKKHDCLSFMYWSLRCRSFRRQRCRAEIWSSGKSSMSWRNFRCCCLSQKHQNVVSEAQTSWGIVSIRLPFSFFSFQTHPSSNGNSYIIECFRELTPS